MNQNKTFTKRIYSLSDFFGDLIYLSTHFPLAILSQYKINKAFSERIMLAVTSVNDCRYCTWFHRKMALKAQVPSQQIQSILAQKPDESIPQEEMTALYFAFHFAETNRKPQPEIMQKLKNEYGKRSQGIFFHIRMIYFGNMCGNTFDAFISRFRGQKAPQSWFCSELIIFLLSAPVLLPLYPVMNKKNT